MLPELIPQGKIHSVVEGLFSSETLPKVKLAGRSKYFLKNWKKLTGDKKILKIVQGYKIPFQMDPIQVRVPHSQKMNSDQSTLVNQEIESMLQKGAIQKVPHVSGEFLSNLFLVHKSDEGKRPVIHLKNLNSFIPYQHFKMEGLHLMKDLLQEGDYMRKINLCDAYFTIPINQKYRKYLMFKWEGTLYEFLCLCFGLGPAPLIFTKLMKVPISLLRRLNSRLIIYLDNMLIMARSVQELIFHQDTVIYFKQNLGFVLNLKKSVLEPYQKIEFLGMVIDSMKMEISLPQEKLVKLISQCKQVAESKEITIIGLTKLIGKLGSTAQAILPAQLQVRHCQRLQIQALKLSKCYHAKAHLDKDAKDELFW